MFKKWRERRREKKAQKNAERADLKIRPGETKSSRLADGRRVTASLDEQGRRATFDIGEEGP